MKEILKDYNMVTLENGELSREEVRHKMEITVRFHSWKVHTVSQTHRDRKWNSCYQGLWGEWRMGSYCLMGNFCLEDEKVLEVGGGDINIYNTIYNVYTI